MKNNNKRDSIFVNKITPPDEVKAVSKEPVGKADENAFCIFNHQRHAVGSVINQRDGSETICTKDGSWQDSNK